MVWYIELESKSRLQIGLEWVGLGWVVRWQTHLVFRMNGFLSSRDELEKVLDANTFSSRQRIHNDQPP